MRKYHVCYRCQELGHYAINYPNPKKPQDHVPLCGNYKTVGHPIDEYPHPKNDYSPNDRDLKRGKRIRIQDPKDEEKGARDVNHIQHFSTPLSRARKVNVVTTRSKAPQETYLIIDENSDEPSVEELRDNLRENDPRNKLLMEPNAVLGTTTTPMALSHVELVQPVPPRPYTILECHLNLVIHKAGQWKLSPNRRLTKYHM